MQEKQKKDFRFLHREYRPGGDSLAGAEALGDGGHGRHGVSGLATIAELDQYKGENRTDIFLKSG